MSNLSNLVICAESIMKQVPVFAVCSDTFKSYQEKNFKPKYQDDFLQEIIKNIKDIGEVHYLRNKKIYNITAKTSSCLLLSSILQITQAPLAQLKELYNQPSNTIH